MPCPARQSESDTEPEFGKIYHLNNVGLKNNVHKWSENISSEQCWLEEQCSQVVRKYHLNNVGLKDTWFANESWGTLVNEAWVTLEWMKLEGHLWMKLDLQCSEYMSNNMAMPSTICSQTACWPVLRSNEAQEYWHTSNLIQMVRTKKFTQGTQRDSAQAPSQLLNSFELRVELDQLRRCTALFVRDD